MNQPNYTPRHVLFVVPPAVHLLDVNGPAHIFYEARAYGAALELHFAAIDEQPDVESSAGLRFSGLVPFHQFSLSADDIVFVPGLDSQLLTDGAFIRRINPFLAWLAEQADRGASICSVCTGAFLLAEAGLLKGRSCTTHWKYHSLFSERYPEVQFLRNRLFVVHQNVYSSAGVASGIDLALYVLEERFGVRLAAEVAKEVVVYFRRSQSDPQLSVFLQYRNHLDDRVHEVQHYLAQHLSAPCPIPEVAEKVHMSPRNLTRLFKKTTSLTIGGYVEKLRVERAVHLLGEGHKVAQVAHACGLKSSNQLRSLLRKHKGILPTDPSGFS